MLHLIEQYCKGTFRSYKVFRASGEVVQHSEDNFQEWDFNDNHVLTIAEYQNLERKIIVQTNKWTLTFNNKRYYIQIASVRMQIELITVNHTGLVVEDLSRREKIFFARLPAWEHFIQNKLPVL